MNNYSLDASVLAAVVIAIAQSSASAANDLST